MPKVTVKFADGTVNAVEVESGMDLYEALCEAGLIRQNSCGLGGQCGTCFINVEEGRVGDPNDGAELSEMDSEELDTCEANGLDPEKQVLSCSVRVFGDVVVSEPEF